MRRALTLGILGLTGVMALGSTSIAADDKPRSGWTHRNLRSSASGRRTM